MINQNLFKVCLGELLFLLCIFSSLKAEADYLDKIEFRPIEKEKVVETLELISAVIRSNYEQIKTWQADVDAYSETVHSNDYVESVFKEIIKYKETLPQEIVGRSNRKIRLILDTQTENLYQHSVRQGPIRYFDANNNNEIAASAESFESSYIVTPTYYINCIGYRKKGDTTTGFRAIKDQIRNQRETIMKKDIFDPRKMIYMATPVWDYLDMWQRKLREHNGDWKIGIYSGKYEEGHNGNNIVYHLTLPGKVTESEYIFISMYFSGKEAFNIIKLETRLSDSKVLGAMTCEYNNINGVYVPKKIRGVSFNSKDGSLVRREEYLFTDQILNQELPTETFTHKNLGLKNNDIFIDKILSKEYRYNADTKSLDPIEK